MNSSQQIAKHFREIYFGGNWTCSNLKEQLADVSWQEANAKIASFNTIAALSWHIHYFTRAALHVLQGHALDAHDKFSFDHPPIQSEADWASMLDKTWSEGETFAALIEALPEEKLGENFVEEKYGLYYRNLHGIIEHAHYHLGQIVILKKLLRAGQ